MICTGFLLVGGQGRRMGGGKALRLFEQRPLWTYGRDLLQQSCQEVRLLGACPELGLETLVESDPGQGPLGALLYALEVTQTPWNLILALDYPCLTLEVLRRLQPAGPNPGACLPRCQGQAHPLCGYYHKRVSQGLARSYEQGERSLLKALKSLGPAVSWIDFLDPGPFLNVNRPSDLVRDGYTGCSDPG